MGQQLLHNIDRFCIFKIRLGGDEPNLIERVVSGGNEALLDSLVMDEENNNLYTISKTSVSFFQFFYTCNDIVLPIVIANKIM